MSFDICVIGHVTKDIIETDAGQLTQPGGTAYYTAMALKALGANVAVITKVQARDVSLLTELKAARIGVFVGKSDHTSTFKNAYSRDDRDVRQQWVNAVANPFTIEDMSHCKAPLYHLGPLTRGDIPLRVLRFLAERGEISLDVQGFVRDLAHEKGQAWARVTSTAWRDQRSALRFVNILKADEQEARGLSKERDLIDIAEELCDYGPQEIIITRASRPSLIYAQGHAHWIPAFAPRRNMAAIDPTGCGDTYMAGYLFYRNKTTRLDDVGRFAALTATLKLERGGVLKANENDVHNLAKEQGRPLSLLTT